MLTLLSDVTSSTPLSALILTSLSTSRHVAKVIVGVNFAVVVDVGSVGVAVVVDVDCVSLVLR